MDLTYLWLLATPLMLLQHFEATVVSPMEKEGHMVEEGPLVQLPHMAHRREKRCSCENQKDKECIFFCHIGIVWVNTPSHVVPYGFGPVRLRRDLLRCFCTDPQDAECFSFCSDHTHTLDQNMMDKMKRSRGAFWEKRSRRALKEQT